MGENPQESLENTINTMVFLCFKFLVHQYFLQFDSSICCTLSLGLDYTHVKFNPSLIKHDGWKNAFPFLLGPVVTFQALSLLNLGVLDLRIC